jgi:hypothetical protein
MQGARHKSNDKLELRSPRGENRPGDSGNIAAVAVRGHVLQAEKFSQFRPRVPMTGAEFLAKASKLANEKARELGWIV